MGSDPTGPSPSRPHEPRRSPGQPVEGEPLSWPLVERRRERQAAPPAVERRRMVDELSLRSSAAIDATPLAPFRIGALLGAFIRGIDDFRWSDTTLTVSTVIIVVLTVFCIVRPVPYVNDYHSRARSIIELGIVSAVVVVTGGWVSPFALCLVPSAMLASFVAGTMFSAEFVAAAAAIVTFQYVRDVGSRDALPDSALWVGLLALVTFTSGLSHRAAQESAQQQQAALDRVGRLAEANGLLFSLQRVAQTLPASLDLEDVLDSTVARVESLIDHSMLTIMLLTGVPEQFEPVRVNGYSGVESMRAVELPPALHEALSAPKTVRRDDITSPAHAVAPAARSGLYAALRARGSVIGLIAVESLDPNHFGPQQAEVLHGLAEPFGIAIDNARLFRQLRIVSADEERSRIARDLHDHIGSSLAYLGFEIDRSIASAARGEPVDDALKVLRTQVTGMIGEVRETLYDLRSDVSETHDLATTLREFVDRVRGRSGLDVDFNCDQQVRLGLAQERELWHIAREALINVERHAQATKAAVEWLTTPLSAVLTITDNGVGIVSGSGRADSYGMRGMRERANNIGAEMTTESSPTGTVIRVGLHQPKGANAWR